MRAAALGLKARTGRAILVALAADGDDVQVFERLELKLLRPGDFAPYHAVEGMAPAAADRRVRSLIADAHRLAEDGLREAARRQAAKGNALRGCGVLVGDGMPSWSTQEILAVHVRMHQAEGELFREVLVAGARACGLPLTTLREKAAFEAAARRLGTTRARLEARVAALGKAVGPPWGKDQKEAAAAALVALER